MAIRSLVTLLEGVSLAAAWLTVAERSGGKRCSCGGRCAGGWQVLRVSVWWGALRWCVVVDPGPSVGVVVVNALLF